MGAFYLQLLGISMAAKLIDGVTVNLRGTEFVVPPLTFGQLKRLAPQIEALSVGGQAATTASIAGAIAIVQSALSSNYPDITVEQVEDLLDTKNMATVIQAIMGNSGLVQSGEALAGN